MVAAIDTWSRAVFAQFDIRVFEVVPDPAQEGRWILDTDRGRKILDSYRDVQAFWRNFDVSEYLAQHGYRRVPRMIRTMYGDPYIQVQGEWIVLTDWIDGRALRFSPEDVLPAVRNLAQIHEALRGFEYLEDEAIQPTRTWQEIMQTTVHDMEVALREWDQSRTRDKFQNDFLEHREWVQKQNRNVANAFSKESDVCDELARCLGGLPFEIQWITQNGKVYLKEIPKPFSDTPIFDLARCCLNAVEQGHPDAVVDMIQEYQNTREVTETDLQKIVTYASFPHALWKIFYLYRRKRANPLQLNELFDKILEQHMQRVQRFEPYRSNLLQEKFQ